MGTLDEYLEEQLQDPEFAKEYIKAKREIIHADLEVVSVRKGGVELTLEPVQEDL